MKVKVRIVTSFHFCHYVDQLGEEVFPLVISQSGYSTNSIEAAKKIKAMGKACISLTGDVNSDIQYACDLTVDYGMGQETVGYVTKGVVILVEFLMLFGLEAALLLERIDGKEYERVLNLMGKTMKAHGLVYEAANRFYEENRVQLKEMRKAYILACGANVGTAMEGALKLGETTHCLSVAYEIEEYIHGPNIQLKDDYTVFFVDNDDGTHGRIHQIKEATGCFTSNVYLLSGEKISRGAGIGEGERELFHLLSPLYNVVYFQYLAYRITEDTQRWEDNGEEYDRFDSMVHSKTETYEKMYEAGLIT